MLIACSYRPGVTYRRAHLAPSFVGGAVNLSHSIMANEKNQVLSTKWMVLPKHYQLLTLAFHMHM